jgi:MIP family channel proteins
MSAEIFGTFIFFFLGFTSIAVVLNAPDAISSAGIAAAFGLGLAFAIFAFGHFCGGHFNPAVTLGLAFGGQFPWYEVPAYWLAQLAGGTAAAAVVGATFNGPVEAALLTQPTGATSDGQAWFLEFITTAIFVVVISAVATDPRAPWSGVLAPLAIGGFIFLAVLVVGPVSGGSFNPARSLAPAILSGIGENLWIYMSAPFAGGAVGGLLYWFIRKPTSGLSPTGS